MKIRPRVKYSCGHSWIECPECGWNTPIDWKPERQIVAGLTAGGAFPIDEVVMEALKENEKKRKKAWAIASRHCSRHCEGR